MNKEARDARQSLGQPVTGGVLLIGDHASNRIPPGIELGIAPHLLSLHIASDIGVAGVAQRLVATGAVEAAILGGVSRLVIDCNRERGAAGLIPIASDGHAIPGNAVSHAEREERIARYYDPYHAHIAAVIQRARPAMILSLHSFTPQLAERPEEQRPWHVGILYNQDERLARIAIPAFAAQGLMVGDQQPYSGRLLNYTMNAHAEGNGIPYLGIEMRQDGVQDDGGQSTMAERISHIITICRQNLASQSPLGQ